MIEGESSYPVNQLASEDFITILGDENGVFELCRSKSIDCANCPVIRCIQVYFIRAFTDDGLDGETVARAHNAFESVANMQNVRLTVKLCPDSVPCQYWHH